MASVQSLNPAVTQERFEIKPRSEPQRKLLSTTADIALVGGAAGGGKAGLLTTTGNASILGFDLTDSAQKEAFVKKFSNKVCTPFGFKLLDDIEVGDKVCNPDGTTSSVVAVHPTQVQPCLRVRFHDGVSVVVGEDHLWSIKISGQRNRRKIVDPYLDSDEFTTQQRFNTELMRRYKTVTTLELAELVNRVHRDKRKGTRPRWPLIPVTEPINSQRSSGLLVTAPPYTLGVLLGDGGLTQETPTWTKPDAFLASEIGDELQEWCFDDQVRKRKGAGSYSIVGCAIQRCLESLKLAGLKSPEKFVPKFYLNAPLPMRIAIVQGLLDTDGHVDSRGQCYFDTTSFQLVKDVQYLIRSLGFTATRTSKPEPTYVYLGEKKVGLPAYRLYITGRNRQILFRLPRKKNRVQEIQTEGGRRVVAVEPLSGKFETRCISVSHPNGLYLTNNFIVTHNSYVLLADPLRHIRKRGFGCVIFRRTWPEIKNEGALWDEALEMYMPTGAKANFSDRFFTWPSGASISFAGMEDEKDKFKFQGAQICEIGLDEATRFEESQFWYLVSRNRSMCGVRPTFRMSCNPDADHWLAPFIQWWWDEETGYSIPERSGVVRWFVRISETIYWDESWKALHRMFPTKVAKPGDYLDRERVAPKSFTFIHSDIYDNQVLLAKNPQYLADLQSLPLVERERLLHGNWKIRPSAGKIFPYGCTEIVGACPRGIEKLVRYVDKAATAESENPDADYTALVLLGVMDGVYYVIDVVFGRWSVGERNSIMAQVAQLDDDEWGRGKVTLWLEQEPGSGGKESALYSVRQLAGHVVKTERVTGDKITRAGPWSSQWQAKNVKIVKGAWNKEFLDQHHNFPSTAFHDDMVDAAGGAFNKLVQKKQFYVAGAGGRK